MANRQVFPSALFPLRGDISAEAGSVTVLVQGIQGIPVTTATPNNGDVPTYNSTLNTLQWKHGNSVLQVDGVGISADYLMLCGTAFVINYGTDDFLGIRLNGSLIS